jgi:membrane protease YdiL (CAAX protease family)
MTNAVPTALGRRLTIPAFLAIVVADLAVIALLGQVGSSVLEGHEHGDLRTSEQVAWTLLLPVGASALFVFGLVSWLGWWRPVLHEREPVRRWLWAVPVIFVGAALLAIDYQDLSEKSVAFMLLLALAALCVGFSEEGLFRGVGLTAFRGNGFSEARVALWSSVVFGAAHLVNALATGSTAIAQAVAVTFAGYFFYLTRRVSGTLIVPALVHALFDFALLSENVSGDGSYVGALAPILAYPAVAVLLLVRRRSIEPRD